VFLVRYFLYAGSVLLALIFIADWYWPAAQSTAAAQAEATALDKSILRIRSAQKWPQKVVFDTSIPTIVPPPALVAEAPPPPPPFKAAEARNKSAEESVLNAHAEAKPAKAKAPARKVAEVRRRIYRAAPYGPAPYRSAPAPFGTYPVASAWSPWW
jgi:hypothetical protein